MNEHQRRAVKWERCIYSPTCSLDMYVGPGMALPLSLERARCSMMATRRAGRGWALGRNALDLRIAVASDW